MQKITILLLGTLATAPLAAQHSPCAGHETRQIKALSANQTDAYRSGAGIGYALAAELNGYPGPKHLLENAADLGLTAGQRSSVQKIFDAMQQEAITLGKAIIRGEAELDRMFATRSAEPKNLEAATRAIADLQGKLRFVHLRAHLETIPLLTEEQIAKYSELRGYAGGSQKEHSHGH